MIAWIKEAGVAIIAILAIVVLVVFSGSSSQRSEFKIEPVKKELPGIPKSFALPEDAFHEWELIGESENCRVFYRKHIQNRIYWSLCKDGSSSITVK